MARKHEITTQILMHIPLDQIRSVTFYKRDELTTDLLCCEVDGGGDAHIFHEEMTGWNRLLGHLEELPGFNRDWHALVCQPAFEPCTTVAYRR